MCDLLSSEVWLLLILAAVIAAALVCSQSEKKTEHLAAFFTVLGDAMLLLSLRKRDKCLTDP